MLIIIATHNKGKIAEFADIFKDYKFMNLTDFGINNECEEPHDDLSHNALLKVEFYYPLITATNKFKELEKEEDVILIFAEDSGLFVRALPNELGVKSKRFSESCNDDDNNVLLIERLKDEEDRYAYYTTVIASILHEEPLGVMITKGTIEGKISNEIYPEGFAYDKVFKVEFNGEEKYLGELSIHDKNTISSRKKAISVLNGNL